MKKGFLMVLSISVLLIALASFIASCGSSQSSSPTGSGNVLDGQSLMQERCSVCHSTTRITTARFSADQWASILDAMVQKGAQLNSQEKQTLVEYLAATYK
jgi:hypothetical protein